MLILTFSDIFNHYQFNENFKVRYFYRVEALSCILQPIIGLARLIAHRMAKKAVERKK